MVSRYSIKSPMPSLRPADLTVQHINSIREVPPTTHPRMMPKTRILVLLVMHLVPRSGTQGIRHFFPLYNISLTVSRHFFHFSLQILPTIFLWLLFRYFYMYSRHTLTHNTTDSIRIFTHTSSAENNST